LIKIAEIRRLAMGKKVYVDVNLISRLADPLYGNEASISEDQATEILAICNSELELVTSKEMFEEVLKTVNVKTRALLTLVAKLASNVPFSEYSVAITRPTVVSRTGGRRGGAVYSGGGIRFVNDPSFEKLQKIFDANDAKHIFQAVKSQCDYFLTMDQRSILNRVESRGPEIGALCPNLKFVSIRQLSEVI
jgi:predicted nucleic acid-binding protein